MSVMLDDLDVECNPYEGSFEPKSVVCCSFVVVVGALVSCMFLTKYTFSDNLPTTLYLPTYLDINLALRPCPTVLNR